MRRLRKYGNSQVTEDGVVVKDAKGKVTIVSEKTVCKNVIEAFSEMFPGLEIHVYDSTGGYYVIKGGEIKNEINKRGISY